MNSKKLVEMIRQNSGNMKKFALDNDLKYTTLFMATQSDAKVDTMNVTMFIRVAAGLGLTADELAIELGHYDNTSK